MGVYIKGMDMPHEGYREIRVYPNGEVKVLSYFSDRYKAKAVEIPKHGRLIDADALKAEWIRGENDSETDKAWITTVRRSINDAPTVIESEE